MDPWALRTLCQSYKGNGKPHVSWNSSSNQNAPSFNQYPGKHYLSLTLRGNYRLFILEAVLTFYLNNLYYFRPRLCCFNPVKPLCSRTKK